MSETSQPAADETRDEQSEEQNFTSDSEYISGASESERPNFANDNELISNEDEFTNEDANSGEVDTEELPTEEEPIVEPAQSPDESGQSEAGPPESEGFGEEPIQEAIASGSE